MQTPCMLAMLTLLRNVCVCGGHSPHCATLNNPLKPATMDMEYDVTRYAMVLWLLSLIQVYIHTQQMITCAWKDGGLVMLNPCSNQEGLLN
jgi:hypothetical protein